MSPLRAFVIDWDPATLPLRCARLAAAGADVVGQESDDGQRAFEAVVRLAPDILVVWLQCKPSHGRVTAAAIRSSPAGRKLPILFVTDDPDAVPPANLAQVRAAVPDALIDGPHRIAFWVARVAALAAATAAPASGPAA